MRWRTVVACSTTTAFLRVAGFAQEVADAVEVAADLDDGGGGGAEQLGAQDVVGERRGQDLEDFVAGRDGAGDGGGGGGERGDAGDDADVGAAPATRVSTYMAEP